MSTVWFVVDDTDPRLNYSGSWKAISNTHTISNARNSSSVDFDEGSQTGPAFNSTLHATTSNTTVNFRFNGSSYLGVYGTQDGTVGNGQLPDISCLIDNVPTWTFSNQYPAGHTNNNKLACRADSRIGGSSPGEHELIINITNHADSAWYLDYIVFESLVDPVLDGETLQAGNAEIMSSSNYSMLSFGSGWAETPLDSTATSAPGSTASMKFNGTSLSLFGEISGNTSNAASYIVDNQEPVSFQLIPFVSGSTAEASSKNPLFTVSNLSVGHHTVTVALNGTAQGMPLNIDYFYVTSLTREEQAVLSPSPNASSSSTITTGPSISASSEHTKNSRARAGVIVGVVLGVIIPLLFLIIGVVVWRRRVQRKARAVQESLATAWTPEKSSPSMFKNTFGPHAISNSTDSSSSVNHTDRSSANLLTMKLQQRLVVMQEQVHERDQQLAEGSSQRYRALTVHTDSGLRMTGEEPEGMNGGEPIEVPPNYTEI